MQIHELNKRPAKINEAQVTEVDLVGPNSIFNVGSELGKQLAKNPRGLLDPTSIGIAKQNAAAASAASSAKELANPGSEMFSTRGVRGVQAYQAGATAKNTTPQQQLVQVKSNPAVQQLVKNLAMQWKSQGKTSAAKINTTMTEEAQLTPTQLAKIPDAVQMPYQVPGAGTNPNPATQQQTTKLDPKIAALKTRKTAAMRTDFQNWVRPKLQSLGVNLDTIMKDPWAAKTLDSLLNDIAIESLVNPESDQTNAVVEQFFNVVVATNQHLQAARTLSAPMAPASAGNSQQSDKEIVSQSGVPLTAAQIEALGKAMRQSAGGDTTIRNTGNTLLNAIARVAGFKVAET